jgi:hypothetical protein
MASSTASGLRAHCPDGSLTIMAQELALTSAPVDRVQDALVRAMPRVVRLVEQASGRPSDAALPAVVAATPRRTVTARFECAGAVAVAHCDRIEVEQVVSVQLTVRSHDGPGGRIMVSISGAARDGRVRTLSVEGDCIRREIANEAVMATVRDALRAEGIDVEA